MANKSIKNRIFWACSLLYCGAYVSRLNIAVAIPSIRNSFLLSQEQIGIIISGFAICYAFGQMINGAIVDHVDIRKYVLLGSIASGMVNVLFGLSYSYPLLVLLWCLNGLAQSMLWTPVVRILSMYFEGDERKKISFKLSISSNTGHIIGWLLAGQMILIGVWRLSFILPGTITAAIGVVSYFLIPSNYYIKAPNPVQNHKKPHAISKMASVIFVSGLVFILLCTMAKGFIRDGVTSWSPSILMAASDNEIGSSINFSLIIPLLNIIGVIFGHIFFRHFKGDPLILVMRTMLVCSGISILLLFFGLSNVIISAILLSLLCASLNSIGPLLSSYIPMHFDRIGRVGTIAGLVDCFQYLGSGISGSATPIVSTAFTWRGVFLLWIFVCLISAIMANIARKPFEKFRNSLFFKSLAIDKQEI